MNGVIWSDKYGRNHHYLIIIIIGSYALEWENIWMLLGLLLDGIAYMFLFIQ